MPFDIGTIEHDIAVTEAVYGPYSFLVRYRPSKYNDSFHKAFTEQGARESVNYYLTELLVGWDLTRDGQPIPLTADGVATVILPVKLAVVKAVERDVLDPTTSVESPATSDHTAGSSNGTHSAAHSVVMIGPSATPIGSGSAT